MSQIALYHKAFDQFIKLPRQVQKKVSTFLEKFRQNSKNPSLHIEPISTFADPQLRTGRINDQYRAILHAPKSGELYHLLHVDNHDEAMAWAENKIFEWNDFTQSYQVFASPKAVPPLTDLSPPGDAPAAAPENETGFAEQTDEELQAIGVPGILLPSVREITSLNELEKLYDYLPIEALENLMMLLEGSTYDSIVREVREGRVEADDRAAQEASPNNQRSFFELTDDDLLNRMLEGEVAKWRLFLHPSQKRMVEGNFNGPTKVTGGAGTGKTVAALHRAKVLQDRGAASRTQPILFTTYTKSLRDNLADELIGIGVDPGLVQLDNIDHFVMQAARERGVISNDARILDFPGSKTSLELWREVLDFKMSVYDAEFLRDEYQDVILHQHLTNATEYYRASRRGRQRAVSRKNKMEIWGLIEDYQSKKQLENYIDLFEVYNRLADYFSTQAEKPFRHVIADEVQDFSNVHLRLLRFLVAEQADDLFLVGDPLQQIYSRRIVFSHAGINIRGRRSRRLKVNYRTTEQIRRAAVKVIDGIDFNDFDDGVEAKDGYVSLRTGQRPSYEVYDSTQIESEHLLNRVRQYIYPTGGDEPVAPSSICIAALTRNAAKPFRSALHQAGIPYYDLTEKGSPTGDRESGIYLSTFHNLKGLEFKIVFLVDVSADTFPGRPYNYNNWAESKRRAFEESQKALLYVAMTRAIMRVHISGVGERVADL